MLKAENRFRIYLKQRIQKTVYITRKKVIGTRVWDVILVDWDKLKEFSEETNEWKNYYYGDALASGRGYVPHKLSREISNKVPILRVIDKEFLLVKLSREGIDEFFYVLSNADGKQDIREATSVEDIESHGKILYSTLDIDPPEAVPISEILKQLFSIDSGLYLRVDRRHMMVRNGEIRKIRAFLAEGGDVNCIDECGWTMLHHAAHCGNLDIIKLLIDSKCNIHVQEICGRKPIHIAARESHIGVIKLFLRHGVGVNETDKNGWTLLHYAAWKGSLGTVRFLIDYTVETNVKDKCLGKRPIHIAAQEGHRAIVKILLKSSVHIDDIDNSNRTPFYYSVWGKHLETAQFLFDRGADIRIVTKYGSQPLHLAAASSFTNCEIMEFLLDKGLDIEHKCDKGSTPLNFAAFSGALDNVKFLIDKGANLFAVNKDGQTSLTFAKERPEVASFLADRMIDIFQRQGRYGDVLKVYKELIQIQEEKLDFDHPEILSTHFRAATMLYEQARFVDAKNILHNVFGLIGHGDPMDVLYKKCNVRLTICDAQTKFNEAVECYKEVFKRWKEDLSDDNLDTLNIACDKAYDHFKKCEYNETFNTLKVALLKKKSPFDIDQPD